LAHCRDMSVGRVQESVGPSMGQKLVCEECELYPRRVGNCLVCYMTVNR
jgi:hypothetical protein